LKWIVSVSLGSSARDHMVEVELLGEKYRIERRGTDGDKRKAISILNELDGKVDAFGMGGIDLYVCAGKRRYALRDALDLARTPQKTPIVDGTGLKNTLERRVIRQLAEDGRFPLQGKKVLLVSAVDRFGMAEALVEVGADLIIGDLIFVLGVPVKLRSLRTLDLLARVIAPIACRLPISMLYPTGEKQERTETKYARYYEEADVIAGDFHFIKRYMPPRLDGKAIITNTTTPSDIELLREAGVTTLVTTTPRLEGRSFGTNVMEAVIVAASGKRPEELTVRDYEELLEALGFEPTVLDLAS